MKLTEKHPFSNGVINRVGEGIRGRKELNLEDYLMVMAWFDNLNEVVMKIATEEVEQFIYGQEGQSEVLRIKLPVEKSHRVKTDDTIAEKLDRLSTKLSRVQDLAGCRLDIDCSLDCLLLISNRLVKRFETEGAEVKVRNYLVDTQFGYRAIHLHLIAPAGRVEVQLRTKAQAAWANLNEVIGDEFGRFHRYGDLPDDAPEIYDELVQTAQMISVSIRSIEEQKLAILRKMDRGRKKKLVNWLLRRYVRFEIDRLDNKLVALLEQMTKQVKAKEW